MWSALVTAAVLQCQLQVSTCRPNVTIIPRYKQINAGDEVNVTCNANEPLVGCEFDRDKYDLIDLSAGAASKPPSNNSYYGRGLTTGDCGVRMTNFDYDNTRIDCRVRSEKGGWVYKDMKVYQHPGDEKELFFESLPEQTFARPGDNVRILHRLKEPTNFPLSTCEYKFPNNRTVPLLDSTKTSEYAYYGRGLKSGECGIEIFNISKSFVAGLKTSRFHAHLRTFADGYGGAFPTVWLIIAAPPKTTSLAVDTSVTYTAGDTLTAICTALESLLVANITWYLGADVIKHDDDDDSPIIERWGFPDRDQNISQNLSWTLKEEDDGKKLTCQIQHFAMPAPGYINKTSSAIAVIKSLSVNRTRSKSDRLGPEDELEGYSTTVESDTCWVIGISLASLLVLAVCVIVGFIIACSTRRCCFTPQPPDDGRHGPLFAGQVLYNKAEDDPLYDDVMNLSVKTR